MNRRELIRRATAGLTAAGVSGVTVHALDAPVDPTSTLVVFTTDRPISEDMAKRIVDYWDHALKGTRWEGVKALVLGDGLTLDVYQR